MVKTLVGGVLYAYELPPHEEIKPMTIEEEKGTVLKNSVGLNDIQRGLATSKLPWVKSHYRPFFRILFPFLVSLFNHLCILYAGTIFFYLLLHVFNKKSYFFWLFILLCIILSLISRLSWFDKMVITKRFFFYYRKNSAEVRKWPLISIQCINSGGFLCQQHTHTFPPPQWCPHHGQSPAHTRKPRPQTLLRTLLWLCYWSSQENGMHFLLR